jgi:hypothetical protein
MLVSDVKITNKNIEKTINNIKIIGNLSWQTPGMYLAQKIFGNNLLRCIAEKFKGDHYQIYVILDDDPEELLDLIFDTEQKIFEKFSGVKVDIRISVFHPKKDISYIIENSIVHYDRSC